MSFNLIQESWIPVVDQSWRQQSVSLLKLLETWETFREIQAENPPTTLAIHRFLLAILHRTYQEWRDIEHWNEIRKDNGKKAIAYLKSQEDRFDLFHPKYPFMQDPSINVDAAGEVYLASTLHGNNTSTVFCHEHQWSGASLSFEEAARLVLRLQMFDVGGRKTGASDSAAVMPLMDAANILIKGRNLRETLLLNAINYDNNPDDPRPGPVSGEDLPAWERTPAKPKERTPSGYIDYLTYQWRRVRIFQEGNRIVRIAVHPGDRFPKTISANFWECGIAYKNTKQGLLPIKLELQRMLWRDSATFLQSAEDKSKCCSYTVDWLAKLKRSKKFDDLFTRKVQLQVLGLTVDNAKPLVWTSEQFSAPIEYLEDPLLWRKLMIAITVAEGHQKIFRAFQGSCYYALAKGLNPPDTSSKNIGEQARQLSVTLDGKSRYWITLDQAFNFFLDDLQKNGSSELTKWSKTVQEAARDAFTESIASIRNYQARAMALQSLTWTLADLRKTPEERDAEKAKSAKRKAKISK